jgi:hypothetical protein
LKLCYHVAVEGNETAGTRSSRLRLLFSALRELGPRQLGYFALYRFGLRSGHYRRLTPSPELDSASQQILAPARLFGPPDRMRLKEVIGRDGPAKLIGAAEEVVTGEVRLFGGKPVRLELRPPGPLLHWTEYGPEYERGAASAARRFAPGDVKLVWEPARMGWIFPLSRAYTLSGDERYAAAFWGYLEQFLEANPPYLGLNWVSAQEAALRVLAMTLGWQVFADSAHSTPKRAALLARAIGFHADRIPPTLVYALAQNNNHLLSEAAGLYTAGLALPEHPSAGRWRKTGWDQFHQGLRLQIAADGAYVQHSSNYHRLMLQLALWMRMLGLLRGEPFPEVSRRRLAAATRWLLALLDRESGSVPNLGPNDGAYILPLTGLEFEDHRPALQAAAMAFLGERPLADGPWDEMALWLAGRSGTQAIRHSGDQEIGDQRLATPHTLRSSGGESWAYLRAAHFDGRPGHADQLHVDLWWGGLNVAQDAGTYLYNAPPPWDNALAGSEVHNTVTLDGNDQMRRAGRFLYLDWAQAHSIKVEGDPEQACQRITAEHDGYRRIGVTHRRTVTAFRRDRWLVEDALLSSRAESAASGDHEACLSWLLPDWPWEVEEKNSLAVIRLSSPRGPLTLSLLANRASEQPEHAASLQVIRGGELVYGVGEPKSTWGWVSIHYGEKIPALALRLAICGVLPLYFRSEWRLGESVA